MLDKIHYLAGDATDPQLKHGDEAYNYLIHVCNDVGAWGAGFVIPLARRWPQVEQAYHEAFDAMSLGENQIVVVKDNLAVVNMIAQRDVSIIMHGKDILPNIQYDALFKCLDTIGHQAHPKSRFHFPMFGAGLGGGDWHTVAALINAALTYKHETWCYVFEQKWMHLCKSEENHED